MSKGSDRQLWKYVTFASLFNEFYRHLPPSAAKYAFTRTQNSKLKTVFKTLSNIKDGAFYENS